MNRAKIILIKNKLIFLAALMALLLIIASVFLIIRLAASSVNSFSDPKNGTIVIDPGHGGVDGGTNMNGLLEKDINLDIGIRLKNLLEQRGYEVIMTRQEDVSLDKLNNSSSSRHQRDLNARAHIINSSNAQLFLSIHVNCSLSRPSADGSIVFYNDRSELSKALAYCIQRKLNDVPVNGVKRTVHNPVRGNYFLLGYTQIPGVIVETAFISNSAERQELSKDTFKEAIAEAVDIAVEQYLNEQNGSF